MKFEAEEIFFYCLANKPQGPHRPPPSVHQSTSRLRPEQLMAREESHQCLSLPLKGKNVRRWPERFIAETNKHAE